MEQYLRANITDLGMKGSDECRERTVMNVEVYLGGTSCLVRPLGQEYKA